MERLKELWQKLEFIEERGEEIGIWYDDDKCPYCNEATTFLIEQFDAICCVKCNVWLENKCSDPNCEYCQSRPDTPDEAIQFEAEETKSVWNELTTILRG